MPKFIKVLWYLLIILLILTGIIKICPNVLSVAAGLLRLTDEEINIILYTIELLITCPLALYTFGKQRKNMKKCRYDFDIKNDGISLEKYRRYSSLNERLYLYECKMKEEDIELPYYGMEICLNENSLKSVSVPLLMKVYTDIEGNKISFSNINVFVVKNEELLMQKKMEQGSIIEKQIISGKKYLVRMQFLCDEQGEAELLESRMHLYFAVTLSDINGKKYKKFFHLLIQNNMGEKRILSVFSMESQLSYLLKVYKTRSDLLNKSRVG